MFKDIKNNELKNVIYGIGLKKVLNTSIVNDELENDIDVDLDKIYEYTTKIINGDLLIEDIEKNMDKLRKSNENLYNEIKNKIDNDVDFVISDQVKHKETTINNSNTRLSVESYSNFLVENNYNFIANDNNQNDVCNIYVTNDDYEEIMLLENKKNLLKDYLNALYGLKVSSATLTGIAWGVAAFYWSAWWMFGSNVAFAVAATTQAGVMTWFTIESWNTYQYYDNLKKQMEIVLNSDEYKIWYDFLKGNINNFNRDELRKKRGINLSIALGQLTNPSRWTIQGLNKLISKGLNDFIKTTIFKIVARNFSKKAFVFANNSIVKKIVVKATSWANPISFTIAVVDTVLSITSFAIDIIFSEKL